MGTIFDIQRFSLVDGPGIRTTAFFKGCRLRCLWCHNPESLSARPVLRADQKLCIGCGACVSACPAGARRAETAGPHMDRSLCAACGACEKVCPTGALAVVGREMGAEELAALLARDEAFYSSSGGGVTCSGGEPLLQADFLRELLRLLKNRGIHTAVDTAGAAPFEAIRQILPYTDLFLYDLKAMDAALHRRLTGADNGEILENLRRLAAAGARLWIRIPLVEGLNWDAGERTALREFLLSIGGAERIDLLPYHAYGEGKRETLGLPPAGGAYGAPDEAFLQTFRQELSDLTATVSDGK